MSYDYKVTPKTDDTVDLLVNGKHITVKGDWAKKLKTKAPKHTDGSPLADHIHDYVKQVEFLEQRDEINFIETPEMVND